MQKSRKIALGVFILLVCIAGLATGIYFAVKPLKQVDAATEQIPISPTKNSDNEPNEANETSDVDDSEFNVQPSASTIPSESKPVETEPGVKTFKWVLTEQKMTLDGVERVGISVNEKPGYLSPIVVTQGDRVILNVQNNLGASTTIHFHGLLQRGTPHMDGVGGVTQCNIMPGQGFTYDFSTGDQVGTFWWHSHVHGQYMDGLRGPFIIKDRNPTHRNDITIQLADWYHDTADQRMKMIVMNNGTPRVKSGLINGNGQFDCSRTKLPCKTQAPTVFNVKPEEYRVRLINTAGASDFIFSINGHSLTIIEVDGFAVQPYQVQSVTVYIGQRYSVLVDGKGKQGSFLMRSFMLAGNPSVTASPDLNRDTYATWSYESNQALTLPTSNGLLAPLSLDAMFKPLIRVAPPELGASDLNIIFEFDLEQRQTDTFLKWYTEIDLATSDFANRKAGVLANEAYVLPTTEPSLFASINGKPHPATSNIVKVRKGQVVQMVLLHGVQSHSFHLHGFMFYILAQGNLQNRDQLQNVKLNLVDPIMRDTTIIPAPSRTNGNIGYTIIRFVADNPGVWLWHCHIETHMASGLGMTFVVAQDEIPNNIPTRQCEA